MTDNPATSTSPERPSHLRSVNHYKRGGLVMELAQARVRVVDHLEAARTAGGEEVEVLWWKLNHAIDPSQAAPPAIREKFDRCPDHPRLPRETPAHA